MGEDLTTHLLMTADELVAAPRPELLEEPASERCRGVRARLWVAQIEFHQSDATDDERIDAMELDDDLGAGARRLQAVLIDGPIGIPSCWISRSQSAGKSLSYGVIEPGSAP